MKSRTFSQAATFSLSHHHKETGISARALQPQDRSERPITKNRSPLSQTASRFWNPNFVLLPTV